MQLTRGERKALAYHRVVADRLRADPDLVAVALTRLQWYRERNPHSRKYYDRWEQLLRGPLDALLAVVVDPSADGCAMRQENPFVDLISQAERAAIHRRVIAEIDGSAT